MKKITPALEDYLEIILIIRNEMRIVRVKEIAKRLKVKASSVIDALNNLKKQSLAVHERYGYVDLTPQGVKIAKNLYNRHKTLKKFFNRILNLPETVAEEDACKIEHHLSNQTVERIVKFSEFIQSPPHGMNKWLKDFNYFLKYNKRTDKL